MPSASCIPSRRVACMRPRHVSPSSLGGGTAELLTSSSTAGRSPAVCATRVAAPRRLFGLARRTRRQRQRSAQRQPSRATTCVRAGQLRQAPLSTAAQQQAGPAPRRRGPWLGRAPAARLQPRPAQCRCTAAPPRLRRSRCRARARRRVRPSCARPPRMRAPRQRPPSLGTPRPSRCTSRPGSGRWTAQRRRSRSCAARSTSTRAPRPAPLRRRR